MPLRVLRILKRMRMWVQLDIEFHFKFLNMVQRQGLQRGTLICIEKADGKSLGEKATTDEDSLEESDTTDEGFLGEKDAMDGGSLEDSNTTNEGSLEEDDSTHEEVVAGYYLCIKWLSRGQPFADDGDSGSLVFAKFNGKIVPLGLHHGS